MKKTAIIMFSMLFSSAYSQTLPEVVKDVDLNKYTGTWYEIARLPNPFERKLKCITATYTLREDGKITVVNKGHLITDTEKINSARGVAWIPDKKTPAKLKVRFFWPFSGDYWILFLEKDYKYVLVGDPSFKYMWILARDKEMDDATYQMLLKKAVVNGFNVVPVIKVEQNCR
jgi:apolipoprotein D and lipocalin family protein